MPSRNQVRIVFAALLCSIGSGCATQERVCSYTFNAEVDGVLVRDSTGASSTTTAGEQQRFELPCGQQVFSLSKPCYPDLPVTVQPEQGVRIAAARWEQFGYLRVENESESEPVKVGNLPDSPLEVAPATHNVRRLPLGEYELTIQAPFKVPASHRIQVCVREEIVSLRVRTDAADGRPKIEKAHDVRLAHGIGRLRVVTELANVSFRITPEQSAKLRSFLERLTGFANLDEIDPAQAPEAARKALRLLQQLNQRTFNAPEEIELPAGVYLIRHSGQAAGAEPVQVEVHPNWETKVAITASNALVTSKVQ